MHLRQTIFVSSNKKHTPTFPLRTTDLVVAGASTHDLLFNTHNHISTTLLSPSRHRSNGVARRSHCIKTLCTRHNTRSSPKLQPANPLSQLPTSISKSITNTSINTRTSSPRHKSYTLESSQRIDWRRIRIREPISESFWHWRVIACAARQTETTFSC